MEDLRAILQRYLEEHYAMTLSTCADNVPWATSVFYAHSGFSLYFVSSPNSRHAENIAKNPRVAVAINKDYDDWRIIRGVQLEGVAEKVGPLELPRVLAIYTRKFPYVKDFLTEGGLFKIAGKLINAQFYKITPTRILYLDNQRAFGERRELVL